MHHLALRRREFLRMSLLAGASGLVGCSMGSDRPVLRASSEILPREWLKILPTPWRFKDLGIESEIDPYQSALKGKTTDLLALEDGWLGGVSLDELLPIEVEGLMPQFNNAARKFIRAFLNNGQTKVLPVGVSPWVMLFRNGDSWIQKAQETWEVLLEPELKGQLVLPNSPRLLVSLLDNMERPDELRKLILQAKTFDDRHALNWVISGQARVAVLPLKRCMSSLLRDPRLAVALPARGAPLNWTVLIRPGLSKASLPISWLEESWTSPLVGKLLSRGWIAPIAYSKLSLAKSFIRKDFYSVLLPSEKVWANCWTFFPLSEVGQKALEDRWSISVP